MNAVFAIVGSVRALAGLEGSGGCPQCTLGCRRRTMSPFVHEPRSATHPAAQRYKLMSHGVYGEADRRRRCKWWLVNL